MKRIPTSQLAAIAILSIASLTYAQEPCVSYHKKADVVFERPSLIGSGIPVCAQWALEGPENAKVSTGAPSVVEEDFFSDDDPVPSTMKSDGKKVTVKVSHKGYGMGGLHVGDPPQDPEGGSWKECLELSACWTYHYEKTTFRSSGGFTVIVLGCGGGMSWGETPPVTSWATEKICVDKKICPCPRGQ